MSFADKLKKLRLENRMTQQFVADRLNVARSTIAGYETKNRQPSHEKLSSLASLFRVTVDYLIDDDSICLDNDHKPYVVNREEEKLLIAKYRRLSPKSRNMLTEYIHLLELADKERLS